MNSVNDEPSGADNIINIFVNEIYTFESSDFGFSDPLDGNSFNRVKITYSPTDGAVYDGMDPVASGDFATISNTITFIPEDNFYGITSFTFQVEDDGGTLNGGVNLDQTPNTMTVNVLECLAPTIFSDENSFGSTYDFLTHSFSQAYNQAITGTGLSLREAVILANHYDLPGDDTICLGEQATYSLTIQGDNEDGALTGDLDITGSVIIKSDGMFPATIDAGGITDRVFDVRGSGTVFELNIVTVKNADTTVAGAAINAQNGTQLDLNNVTLENNKTTDQGGAVNAIGGVVHIIDSTISSNISGQDGGGLFLGDVTGYIKNSEISSNKNSTGDGGVAGGLSISGTLSNMTISDTLIQNNVADGEGGGAVVNNGATAKFENSTISGNTAGTSGGGINITVSSNVTIDNSVISGNTATISGGGVEIIDNGLGSTLTIIESTLSNNSAVTGGGISASGPNVVTDINSSTISSNAATQAGGGINVSGGTLNIVTSTISSNTAATTGGGMHLAGFSTTNIDNSTITNNSATSTGSGIYGVGATIDLYSSIVAQNASNSDLNNAALSTTTSSGYNLIGNADGSTFAVNSKSSDQFGSLSGSGVIDAKLEGLADNGGPTYTHALADGSPAIDAGDPADTSNDQRGAPNVGTRDIGAFESDSVVPPVFLDLNGDGFHFNSAQDSHVYIGLDNSKNATQIAWVDSNDGVLVYDYQGESILHKDQIAFAGYLEGAKTDLEGLKAFDSDNDGILGKSDSEYNKFGVWQDGNNNGFIDNNEFMTLAQRNISAISLNSDHNEQVQNGNIIHGMSSYLTDDGQSFAVADVSLKVGQIVKGDALHANDILVSQNPIDLSLDTNTQPAPLPAQGVSVPAATDDGSTLSSPIVVVEHIVPPVQTENGC